MKKLIVSIILSCLFAMPCFAMEWINVNSVVVSWDKVTQFENGETISDVEVISYNVYLAKESDTEKASPLLIGNTPDLVKVITFGMDAPEGKYYVGLQTVRSDALGSGAVWSTSRIVWSDDPDVALGGNTFGISYFYSPMAPEGLKHN